MPIPVTCQCGKRFAAKDELAGRRLKCPACGEAISVPAPHAPALDDPLSGLDDFSHPVAGTPGQMPMAGGGWPQQTGGWNAPQHPAFGGPAQPRAGGSFWRPTRIVIAVV